MSKPRFFAALGLCALLPLACVADTTEPPPDDTASVTKEEVVASYAELVHINYVDAHDRAAALQVAIDAFVQSPGPGSLERAKRAWLEARVPYGQTEAFRFYGGPIDADDGPEGRLNAWPLDESYIDSVDGAPDAGIVNDPATYPTIDAELIASLNEVGGEEN
ncbi:MAG: iron-regulated protein, partial [Myxococcales bacterium]|nr:iron-regulated protein [Myxococcales bacterium]